MDEAQMLIAIVAWLAGFFTGVMLLHVSRLVKGAVQKQDGNKFPPIWPM